MDNSKQGKWLMPGENTALIVLKLCLALLLASTEEKLETFRGTCQELKYQVSSVPTLILSAILLLAHSCN